MGVHDKISDLKKRREQLAERVKYDKQVHDAQRQLVALKERELKNAKSASNRAYKVWKEDRAQLAKVERSIKAHNSQVRQWTKEHPMEALK